jgi:hypothetical protein
MSIIIVPPTELITFFTQMLIALTAIQACLEVCQHKYAPFCPANQLQGEPNLALLFFIKCGSLHAAVSISDYTAPKVMTTGE